MSIIIAPGNDCLRCLLTLDTPTTSTLLATHLRTDTYPTTHALHNSFAALAMAYNARMSMVRPTPNGKSRVKQQEEDSFMTLVGVLVHSSANPSSFC